MHRTRFTPSALLRRRSRFTILAIAGALLCVVEGRADVQFVEASQEVGVTYVNHAPGVHGGVLAIDLTRDTYPELFFADYLGYANKLYLNNRDGTFTETPDAWGLQLTDEFTIAAIFFDYDRDGLLDWAATVRNAAGQERVRLFKNLGREFVEVSDQAGLTKVFEAGSQIKPLTAFDYDGDGWLDLFVADMPCDVLEPVCTLYRNQGDGTFELLRPGRLMTTGCIPWQVVSTDFNDDGRTDLFLASDQNALSRLFLNRPDGLLEDVCLDVGLTVDGPDMGVAVGDYDNDGDFDIYTTDITFGAFGGNRLFRNDLSQTGTLFFTNVGRAAGVRDTGGGWGCTFLDYDNDMWLDLSGASGNIATKLFRNRGDGTFDDVGAGLGFAPGGHAFGLIAVDYDMDGDQDIIIVNTNDSVQLFRNDGGDQANWVKVRLYDLPARNPLPIGAKIFVEAGGVAQRKELTAAMSCYSQEQAILHFGLADQTTIDSLRVVWPDGTEDLRTNVGVNRIVEFVHGQRRLPGTELGEPARRP